MRRLFRSEVVVFLLLLAMFLFVGRTELFHDPGTLWHVVVGDKMLAAGAVIRVDTFATPEGRPWIAFQWIAECGMALLHRAAGFEGLLLASATLLATMFAGLVHRLLRGGLSPIFATFVATFVFGASSHHFHARPHLFTIVFLGLTFALLLDLEAAAYDSNGATKPAFVRLALLVPLYVLWTNLHGGVAGGIATLGLAFGGFVLARALGRESPVRSARDAAILAAICALSAAATFVNPFGFEMIRTWLWLSSSPVLPRVIQEHAPLGLEFHDAVIWAFGAFYIALVASVPWRAIRVTWVIPIVWFVLATHRTRHAPLFAIMAGLAIPGVVAASRITRWVVERIPGSLLAPRDPALRPGPWEWRAALVPILAITLIFGLESRQVHASVFGTGVVVLDPKIAPRALVPTIALASARVPDGTGIFDELGFGGFLIYFAPRLRVFIDDRCELYGDEGLSAYADGADVHPERMDAWVRERDLRFALVAPGSKFDRHIEASGAWKRLGETSTARFYERVAVP